MSDLLKKALKKGPPPPNLNDMNEEDEDDYELDEDDLEQLKLQEEAQQKKQQQQQQFGDKFPSMQSGGPIKPMQSFAPPPIPKPKQQSQTQVPQVAAKKLTDYSAVSWDQYYDSKEFYGETPIYKAGSNGPIYFCLHGAGDSAQSFACLAKEVKEFGSVVSFDFRGHGDSKVQDDKDNLAVDTLIKDAQNILEHIAEKYPDPTFIIAGHSMGGSIAAKYCKYALETALASRIVGLIVIDVVEGTAMDALPFMGQIVSSRPQLFKSYDQLVQWSIKSCTLRNVTSARVSMPPKVKEVTDENGQKGYTWNVDLMKSEKHWVSWFQGLTNSFLDVRVPKLLMTAEKERMDKDLTIAQMQGRFKLSVIYNTGHYMQEDDYVNTAVQFHQFLQSFRIPGTVQDQQKVKELGVGKFNPTILPYNPVMHKFKK